MQYAPKLNDKSINFGTALYNYNQSNKLNNINFDPQIFTVYQDPNSIFITLNQPKENVVPEEFTIFSILSTTVQVYGGNLVIGYTNYIIPSAELVINTEKTVIGWEYSYANNTGVIKDFGTPPLVYDMAYMRKPLYEITLTGSVSANNQYSVISKKYDTQVFPANFGGV